MPRLRSGPHTRATCAPYENFQVFQDHLPFMPTPPASPEHSEHHQPRAIGRLYVDTKDKSISGGQDFNLLEQSIKTEPIEHDHHRHSCESKPEHHHSFGGQG